jgi:hypothetical protein
MTHKPLLTFGAGFCLLLAGAAGVAFAHPHPDGEDGGNGKKVERVVIVRDGAGGEHHGKPGKHEVRRFEIHRVGDGGPGEHVRAFRIDGDRLAQCDGGKKIVDESAEDGDRKTKVIICTKGEPSAAAAERLEEALARINDNDELSAEQKARIATALQSAIDRARSAR